MIITPHFRLIQVFFFCTFLFSFMGATAQIKIDTTRASQYYKEADSLLIQKKYEESIALFNKALPEYKKAKAWEKVASCYNKISENQWYKGDESLLSAKKALEISTDYLMEGNKFEADSYDNIGFYHKGVPNYDEALQYYEKALKIREKIFPNEHLDIAKSYSNLGSVYWSTSKYKEALEFHKKALAINLKILGPDHSKTGRNYNNIGLVYDNLGKLDIALEYYKKFLNNTIRNSGSDDIYVGYSYVNMGVTYLNLKQNNNALSYFQKALPILLKENRLNGLKAVYQNMGIVYDIKGEYDKALEYQKKSLEIASKIFGEQHPAIGVIYANISVIFHKKGDEKKEIEYYKKALEIYTASLGENHYLVALSYHNMGNTYSINKEYDKAQKYFNKALSIRNKIFDKNNPNISVSYSGIANLYFRQKMYDESLKYHKKGLTILQNSYGEQHPRAISLYNNIAFVYQIQKNHAKAITNFDKALLSNTKKKFQKGIENTFDPNHYSDWKLLLETLKGKAKTLKDLYQESNDREFLNQSIVIYKNADVLIKNMRKIYQNYEDKVVFAKQVKEIYTDAINTYLLEYEEAKKRSSLTRIFYYMERSKSNILKELLNDSYAKSYTGLPNELLTTEKIIRTNRAFYISQILKEESKKSIDTIKIEEYENELFNINRRRDSLNQSLEKNYPKYFKLKYNNDIVKTSNIQKQLDNKTTLLEFFTGDSITYAFTISKNEIAVQELATPKLTKQVEQFRKSITSKNIQEFKKQSHLLYNALIAPVKEQLKGDELVVVPDGPLWHLNFELLLTQNDVSENPGELSYLLKDYAITYANSANLLFNPFKKVTSEDEKEGCLAFSFSDSTNIVTSKNISLATLRDTGDDLPGTRKEIRAIADIIDGQYYFGAEANEANFKKKANQYKIVHLALHGEVDNERPENSKLFFTKSNDTIEDNLLYAHELFALDIPSELTVLSACNTGTGKIAKGEGIMSLGNAFQYAGTKSLLLSSWEVPDNTAPELMRYFYTNLKAGMHKGKALQQAKLQYLKTADRYHKDPFYWGGFYLVGDSAPIQFRDTNSWYWIIGLGVLLILGLFLYKRKRG